MNYKRVTFFLCLIYLSACNSDKKSISSTDRPQKNYTDIQLSNEEDYLISIPENERSEPEDSVGFVNGKGDTIIPRGEYSHSWTIDTFKTFVIVYDEKKTNSEIIAIDKDENVLFDIVLFDNYPDELSNGLFRVKRNGKIGYANEKGEIVIPCQYQCAFPFEDGQAKVAYNCEMVAEGEHQTSKSEEWFYIDLSGKEVK